MIRLTAAQADLIRGEYKSNYVCEPVKIENGFYMIHDKIKKVKELIKKFDLTKAKKFTKKDEDIYNAYLEAQKLE